MAVLISDVRTELQLPSSIIDDTGVQYAIDKIAEDDINLVCAEVLRMVKRKFRGMTRLTVGKYEEWRDLSQLQKDIDSYVRRSTSSVVDDGFSYPDPRFEEGGI